MLIREKHLQREIIRQALALAPDEIEAAQSRRENVARTGTAGETALNGFYDNSGAFVPYLRCDIDAFDSGRIYAP